MMRIHSSGTTRARRNRTHPVETHALCLTHRSVAGQEVGYQVPYVVLSNAMKRGASPYCDFTVSTQPRSCCSFLIWSILSMISFRLCSIEVFFRCSSSTFNSPASCSQLAIGYPSSCEEWWPSAHFFFLSGKCSLSVSRCQVLKDAVYVPTPLPLSGSALILDLDFSGSSPYTVSCEGGHGEEMDPPYKQYYRHGQTFTRATRPPCR